MLSAGLFNKSNSQCSIGPSNITDNNTTTYTFSNQSVTNWADFQVQINFTTTHTWAGDLRAQVAVSGCSSGNGTYTLFNFQTSGGGSNCDMKGIYTFVRSGTNYLSTNGGAASNPIPACVSNAVPAGMYTSAQQWPSSGSCSGGTITVTINDNQTNDVGAALVHMVGTTGCFPLPVRLTSLAASKGAQGSILTWTTGSEQNSSYFAVEHSADNANWSEIGRVAAAGNSSDLRSYSFTHVNPATGNNFYRLRQVDIDQRFVYSNIVLLKATLSSTDAITVLSNPVTKNYLQLIITSTEKFQSRLMVTDLSGRNVLAAPVNLIRGNNSIMLSLNNLSPGLYIASMKGNAGTHLQAKFIVQ